METYVIHDHLGTIVSMAIVNPGKELTLRRIPPAGCTVTHVKLKKAIDPKDRAAMAALVLEHRVDIETKQLVRIKN
jgi:hypothetical protein